MLDVQRSAIISVVQSAQHRAAQATSLDHLQRNVRPFSPTVPIDFPKLCHTSESSIQTNQAFLGSPVPVMTSILGPSHPIKLHRKSSQSPSQRGRFITQRPALSNPFFSLREKKHPYHCYVSCQRASTSEERSRLTMALRLVSKVSKSYLSVAAQLMSTLEIQMNALLLETK